MKRKLDIEGLRESADHLRMLTSVGCSGPVLTVMIDLSLEAHGGSKMPADVRRYVGGPIIVHSRERNQSGNDLVAKFKSEIMWERAQIGLGLSPWIVGPSELTVVLFEASLEHPFGDALSQVYLWASANAMFKQAGVYKSVDEVWNIIGGGGDVSHRPRIITDAMVLDQEPLRSTYREIAGECRRTVVKHVQAQEKARRQEPAEPALDAAELPLAAE